jgi:DNA-binding transcriptional ArsR family regulator
LRRLSVKTVSHIGRLTIVAIAVSRFVDILINMLDFLVTSTARRRLLTLLWGEMTEGSVSELADAAGVGRTSAYRELQAMTRRGLVVTARRSGRDVFSANRSHPAAEALRALASTRTPRAVVEQRDAALSGQLRTLGAPLPDSPLPVDPDTREDVLVRGVKASHTDPRLARTLPLCFWAQRHSLDVDRLLDTAKQQREKNAVGFFLELTTELSADHRFSEWAQLFRDRRFRAKDFFSTSTTKAQAELAETTTPQVAKEWGFRMNVDLESFKSLFDKFDGIRS